MRKTCRNYVCLAVVLSAGLLPSGARAELPDRIPPGWDAPDVDPRQNPVAFAAMRVKHREALLAYFRSLPAQVRTWDGRIQPGIESAAWTNRRMSFGTTYSSEIVIDVSRANPLHLSAGANDPAAPGGLNGIYASADAGDSWLSPPGGITNPGGFGGSGDPAIAYDLFDRAVYSSLCNGLTGICSARSTDGGQSWPYGAVVFNVGNNNDKNWSAADKSATSPYNGNFYTAWAHYNIGQIRMSRSTDNGLTWQNPPSTVFSGQHSIVTPAVGPDGTVYACASAWSNGAVRVAKSTDGGLTFGAGVTAYQPQGQGGVPPFYGSLQQGLDIDRDPTSPYYGHVYVVSTDGRSGQQNAHVWVAKSTNAGANWSAPVQVDGDVADAREHGFAWVAVCRGEVHAFYYSYECPPPGNSCLFYRYYVASSSDGGVTWTQACAQDASARWADSRSSGTWVGDYESGCCTDDLIYPAWADARPGVPGIQSYTQPMPKPMPWISSVIPGIVPAGLTSSVAIGGGNFAATRTPLAVVFDDPAISASIVNTTNNTITLNVSVGGAVSPGPHEYSIQWGVPVPGATVVAAIHSSCRNSLDVIVPTPTPGGPVQSPTPTYTQGACRLGYNVNGIATVVSAGVMHMTGFQLQFPATFNAITVYTHSSGHPFTASLYASNPQGTQPTVLLAQTGVGTSIANVWTDVPMPYQTLAPGYYWIGIKGGQPSGTAIFRRAAPALPVLNPLLGRMAVFASWNGGAWPAAFPGGVRVPCEAYSAYARCGSPPTTTPTATYTQTQTPVTGLQPWPNPYERSSGTGVSFGWMPVGSKLSIYNLAGERVFHLEVVDASAPVVWSVLSPGGYPMARGAYTAKAEYPDAIEPFYARIVLR